MKHCPLLTASSNTILPPSFLPQRTGPGVDKHRGAAVNRNDDVQEKSAGGCGGRADCGQCDGPTILRPTQRHEPLVVSVRRCELDVHSRRGDGGSSEYGE